MLQARSRPSVHHILALLGCCFLSAVSIGMCINSYGVFLQPISTALQVGMGDISVHASISSIATGLLSPLAFKLMKRFRFKHFCCIGILMAAGSTLLMAFAEEVWQYNLLGLIRGAGAACFSLAVITTVIVNWFNKFRSLAIGIVMSFAGISGALFSPIFTWQIATFGYPMAYVLMSIEMLVIGIIPTLTMLELSPESKGLLPYGNEQDGDGQEQENTDRFHAFTPTASLYISLCLLVLTTILVTGLTQHVSGYAINVGLDASIGALLISCIMVGNILSKLLMGLLNDRMGCFRSNILMIISCMIGLCLLMAFPQQTPLLMLGAFLFGSIYSVTAVGLSNLTYSLYGKQQYGQAYALLSSLSCMGAAVSLSLVGYLFDWTQSYVASLVFCGVCAIASILLVGLLSNRNQRAKA